MGLRWFDIHSPHSKHSCGQIEVDYDKIVRTSPAYRWALGLHFPTKITHWEREGFYLVERFECNCKSFDKPGKYKTCPPTESQLFHRVSP